MMARYFRLAAVSVGIILTLMIVGLIGLNQLGVMVMGWIFPGSQFSYSSDSKTPRVFKLTLDNDPKYVLIQVPEDYVSALYPGGHGGYWMVELTMYLPDMISKPDYYQLHPELRGQEVMPKSQIDDELVVSLSESYNGPDDPTGEISVVQDNVDYARKKETPMIDNPYQNYDAYLFGTIVPETLADKEKIMTDLLPKNRKDYYISCDGEPIVETYCDLRYVYKDKFDVDINMPSNYIPDSEKIMSKISQMIGRFENIKRSFSLNFVLE